MFRGEDTPRSCSMQRRLTSCGEVGSFRAPLLGSGLDFEAIEHRRIHAMVTIRLTRGGTNKIPFYRIVVANSRAKRDGRFIEAIGTWDPTDGEGKLVLDQARFDHWVKLGARPSEVVGQIAKRAAKAAAKSA